MASPSKIIICLLFLFSVPSISQQAWVQSGYWYVGSNFPATEINSALFTHLLCGFADIDPFTYKVSIPSANHQSFATFTGTVKTRNPGVTTLLSIWAGTTNSSLFFKMANEPTHRKSFIESTIQTARLYDFHGVELFWAWPGSGGNATNMGAFFSEWRAAADSESKSTNKTRILLTLAVRYEPVLGSVAYPINSIRENLDWVNIVAYDYYLPLRDNFTGAHAALYDPSSRVSTDHGLKEWVRKGGLPGSKALLGLPYHGYAWGLVSPNEGMGVGARASGPAITKDGSVGYAFVKLLLRTQQGNSVYNATYVENFYSFGSTWIGYDDVEAITTKVAYAKNMGLLGYSVFQVGNDDNWALSLAAAAQHKVKGDRNKRRFLVTVVLSVSMGTLFLGFTAFYVRWRLRRSKGMTHPDDEEPTGVTEDLNRNDVPHLRAFSFVDIKAATNNFSIENKLGEGGYGSVYKGKLRRGREIAVKRLSLTSEQGVEEFRNEVTLTAKLQHVNLLKVLGFCTESEEKMLVYEYMPNKSLDLYLFDPIKRRPLDWEKRVEIIEGIIQGLLYLQEYSRLTIIHRDLKASNILLDSQMKPKISDFGMARIFRKGEHEANTGRIVGTYGCVPPEYVRKGIYSTKYDVYSFGVLLLQIISGKRNKCLYGPFNNLNLLEYAYELWSDGNGMEFMDPLFDDSSSSCKLMKCLQVALLCVQERGEDRPSMLGVSLMLKNETAAIPTPRRPAFSTKRDEDGGDESKPQQDFCSNYVSISEMVPR